MHHRSSARLCATSFFIVNFLASCVSDNSFEYREKSKEDQRTLAPDAVIAFDRRTFASLKPVFTVDALAKPQIENGMKKIAALEQSDFYQDSRLALKVMDLDSGEVLVDHLGQEPFFIGSVRKLFSVGEWLLAKGGDDRFTTPVFKNGALEKNGRLKGDLILVASGDLTMGGRKGPGGTLDVPDFDHNEANTLGNAKLAKENPLAGFESLAKQVSASGIKEIRGDVIIDDRLFEPFNFRDEFYVTPIFVNDDVIDISLVSTKIGKNASVTARPDSAAFKVNSDVLTVKNSETFSLNLSSPSPKCMTKPGCTGLVSGKIPMDFLPPAPFNFSPIIRTFRISDPAAFARTVFIEALERHGVRVLAKAVASNPSTKLPALGSYIQSEKVAELISPPLREYAKFILKVSYNIGADTSLLLFGLTKGANTLAKSLAAEKGFLEKQVKIGPKDFHFIDGSGGGDTSANADAVLKMLMFMSRSKEFETFKASLPNLGLDGSLASIKNFTKVKGLEKALGNIAAKTGTYITAEDAKVIIKAQALAGYITSKSGRRLAYALFVNNVSSTSKSLFADVQKISEDLGEISATIWADN